MSYLSRTSGRRWSQDPASSGIFIHGGTCLMHGPSDPFRGNAAPNRFTITWPTINNAHPFASPSSFPACRTFQRAVRMAEEIREKNPVLHHASIFACTDLNRDTSYSASWGVQLVSHRLRKNAIVSMPDAAAA